MQRVFFHPSMGFSASMARKVDGFFILYGRSAAPFKEKLRSGCTTSKW